MSTTLLLVMIIVVGFVLGHIANRFASRFFALGGAEYALVGVLIGPLTPWHLLDDATLQAFMPLVNLLLGLIGFVLGAHTKAALKNAEFSLGGLVAAIVVLVLGTTLCSLVVPYLADDKGETPLAYWRITQIGYYYLEIRLTPTQLWTSLGLGAAMTVSSAGAVELAMEKLPASGKVTDFLRSAAAISQVLAVFVIGLVLAGNRATSGAQRMDLSITEWGVLTAFIGLCCGALFGLFIGRESNVQKLFLASVGLVIFASGIGSALGISPLFVNLLAGLTVSLSSPHALTISKALDRLQHPVYILLMMFAGMIWVPVSGWLWLLPFGYVFIRMSLKRLGTNLANNSVLVEPLVVRRLGSGLIGQGAVAVAIGLSLSLQSPRHSLLVLNTVLIGAFFCDIFASRQLRALLADAGEITTLDVEETTSPSNPGPQTSASSNPHLSNDSTAGNHS